MGTKPFIEVLRLGLPCMQFQGMCCSRLHLHGRCHLPVRPTSACDHLNMCPHVGCAVQQCSLHEKHISESLKGAAEA